MPKNPHKRLLIIIAYAAAAIIAAWLAFKYALPWLSPFILAFLTAMALEPVIRKLVNKYNFVRGFAAALCTAIALTLIIGIITFASGRAIYELTAFLKTLPNMLARIPSIGASLEGILTEYIAGAPKEVQDYLFSAIDGFGEKILELPAELSGKLLGFFSSVAAAAPKIVLFAVTYAIGVFFMSCYYREITTFILRQIPPRLQSEVCVLKRDLFSTLLKWLKAQISLMCITFLELTAAFFIIKIDYPALLALLVALIDALPILGVGTVLIPWALIELIYGHTVFAFSLIIIYAVVALVRSLLEPKFVGAQIGLNPVITLMAMYVGFCSIGILGMILFPIGTIMIKQLNDKGYIKLWK